MEELKQLLLTENFPIFAAFLLGIVSTFDPCPLTLNISAISYISNDLKRKWEVIVRGSIYTLGRMAMFTLLSLIVVLGADALKVGEMLSRYGEKFLGIFMLAAGFLMLDIVHFHLHPSGDIKPLGGDSRGKSYVRTFLLGALFSLAFCPHTLLYLGMLVPLNLPSLQTFILPPVFALGGGVPIMVFAFVVAFCMSNIGTVYHKVQILEKRMRKITAIIFIFVGLYLIIENFLLD